ncbi:MAG: GAF domain-containing protein [Oscillatoriophycideae cyanobacterium NC_groundwater_1537_Pr4_S-0.65um_50_18]|nr:GAF domain-containing protein [Oscillatoriophycideae cyanobacterium NC_groundwater_1537_Pr4_S-0.65um_50_18]
MNLKRWLLRLCTLSIQHRFALGLLLLMAASYGGNLARWTLFFNIDFIFGSIAAWLVVSLYGVRWGTLAGFVGGTCTYFLWHHPYAAVIFTCETLFVGQFFYRYRQNLVLLDGLFWLLIGMPLIGLFYGLALRVDPAQVEIILFKQPVNGIFNALIASLLLTYLPIHRWLGRPQLVSTLTFRQTLFNVLVAFVLLPTLLLIVLDSRDVVENIRTEAQAELSSASEHTTAELRSWYQEHLRSIDELAYQVTDTQLAQLSSLEQNLASTQRRLTDFIHLAVLGKEDIPVLSDATLAFVPASNQPYFQIAKDTLQPIFSDVLPNSVPPTVIWNVPIVQENRLSGMIVCEIALDSIDAILERNADEQQIDMTLVGRNASTLASTLPDRLSGIPFDRRQNGILEWLDSQSYQWFPTQASPLVMVRWMKSSFVQESSIVTGLPWTLIAEFSAAPNVRYIQSIFSRNLAIVLAIAILALMFAALISRQMVRPLSQLAQATTNLPDKLLAGNPIDWSESQVTEIAFLVRNFRTMSTQLSHQFQEVRQVLNYESLLKRITDKVRDSLDESQILQTAVQELGQGLSVTCCDAALYNIEQTISTICYEYTTLMPSAQGAVFQILDEFSEVYAHLLRGEYCQFNSINPLTVRSLAKRFTILAYPIVDDQRVLGDLWLFKPRETVFSDAEIRLVQQVANQCAIALRQARLYQAAQIQVKALEELNHLKDDFLSTVSHELRTPITNIKMAIKMLKLTNQEERRETYFKILEVECDREADLIDDLLDLQRLASGTKALNLEPIHLQDWVTHIVESFQERTRNREQILQVEIPDGLPIITSDSLCLERILTELLNNACKYTPPGEQIKVSARTVASVVPGGSTLDRPSADGFSQIPLFILDVCNSGVEIPASELSHIFEKFYRVPGGDPWKQGGTGLGLTLVQKMAEHLGGSIHVASTAQRTCFTVELPLWLAK